MKGPEIHPAVDATKLQAQRTAEAFSKAIAEANALAEVVKRRRCKRAVIALLTRAVAAVTLSILVVMCKKYGLMSWEVSFVAITALSSWLSLWAGAWLQFMWGKEGLLR